MDPVDLTIQRSVSHFLVVGLIEELLMQTTRLCNEIQFFMTCIGFKGTAIPFEPKDIKSEFLKEQKLRQSCQI